ncbi:MAG: hypothetical protein ACRESS_00715 [Stenotrophobium sp.]
MLTKLLIELSPLKMVFCGMLFFWASWLATKKILICSIIGVTIGETTFDALRGQVESIGTNQWVLDAASAAGMPIHNGSALSALIANVLLALSMMALAEAIRMYTRAKRLDMEQEFRGQEVQGNYLHRPGYGKSGRPG